MTEEGEIAPFTNINRHMKLNCTVYKHNSTHET